MADVTHWTSHKHTFKMTIKCTSAHCLDGLQLSRFAVVRAHNPFAQNQVTTYDIRPDMTVELPIKAVNLILQVVDKESWGNIIDGRSGRGNGKIGGVLTYKFIKENAVGHFFLDKNTEHLPWRGIQREYNPYQALGPEHGYLA